MSYTNNLDNYMKMKETDSCYLDGRYFYKVFENYPGLLRNPLEVSIRGRRIRQRYPHAAKFAEKEIFSINMAQSKINTDFPGLLKLVITTPTSKHSNLLILDYQAGVVHRFEPLGRTGPYFEKVNELIEEYLSLYLDMEVNIIDVDLDEILDEKNPACLARGQRSGFCNAYNILYAYSYLNGKDFDPRHIRRFAKMIETTYGPLPADGKEQEYGLWGNPNPQQGKNTAIGAGAGALGGALLLGPVGLIGGGLLGAGVGSTL